MATVADVLVTKYQLDSSQYKAGADQVTSATSLLEGGVGAAAAVVAALTAGLLAAGAAVAGVAKGTIEFALAASKAGAELESVKMGFQAYAANAAEAEENLKRLRIVAQLPGLGFKEAIQGSTRLQAVGMDARLAERSMMAFGNALALVGGGKDDLGGVILALSQIASKGQVSAEEINQIAERVPQIRTAMKEAFGTANTEVLQKKGLTPEAFIVGIVGALEKLPKATGGAKNAFENFQDSVFVALATIGEQVNKVFGPMINTVSSFIDYLGSSGIVDSFASTFANLFQVDNDGLVYMLSYLTAFLEKLPSMMMYAAEVAKEVGRNILETINSVITNLNVFLNSGPAKFLGLKALSPVGSMALEAGGKLQEFGAGLDTRAKVIADGFKNAKPVQLTDGGPGRFKSDGTPSDGVAGGLQPDGKLTDGGPIVSTQTDLLRQIAHNTSPIPDLKRMALGGGDMGAFGVTPVRLQNMKHPHGNDPARHIQAAIGIIFNDSSMARNRRMA